MPDHLTDEQLDYLRGTCKESLRDEQPYVYVPRENMRQIDQVMDEVAERRARD